LTDIFSVILGFVHPITICTAGSLDSNTGGIIA